MQLNIKPWAMLFHHTLDAEQGTLHGSYAGLFIAIHSSMVRTGTKSPV